MPRRGRRSSPPWRPPWPRLGRTPSSSGGESLYRQTLDRCQTVYVTKLHRAYPGADRFFPDLDRDPAWVLAEAEGPYVFGDLAYTYCRYRRAGARG